MIIRKIGMIYSTFLDAFRLTFIASDVGNEQLPNQILGMKRDEIIIDAVFNMEYLDIAMARRLKAHRFSQFIIQPTALRCRNIIEFLEVLECNVRLILNENFICRRYLIPSVVNRVRRSDIRFTLHHIYQYERIYNPPPPDDLQFIEE